MIQAGTDVYDRYLVRFADRFGNVPVGEPVRNEGKLVMKLSVDQFSKKWKECKDLEGFLRNSMSNGHTLSDAVEYEYKELCAAVLEKPKDFKLM